jgi:signal transduction histidine kinase
MGITGQVRLGMVGMLLLTMGICFSGFHELALLRLGIAQNIEQQETFTRPVAHITVQTLQCRRYEKDMFLNLADRQTFEKYINLWAISVDSLTSAISRYRHHAITTRQIQDSEKWLATAVAYQQQVLLVIKKIQDGQINSPTQANEQLAPHKDIIRSLIDNGNTAFDNEFARSSSSGKELLHQTEQTRDLMMILLLGIVLFSMAVLIVIPHRLLGPIKQLDKAVCNLRDGDLSSRVDVHQTANEIGRLGLVFNQMAQELQNRQTELLEAHDNAISLNLAKTRFLMNMSHELRTPLTAILGFTDLLEDQETRDESIEIINRSGQHLLHIVDDLLELTEIETHQFQLSTSTIQLNTLLEEVIEELSPVAREKQIQLIMPDRGLMTHEIVTDPLRLKGVFFHLLGNAIKFTAQGHVALHCLLSEDQQHLVVKIQDTGMGMTTRQINRAGLLFEQGDDSLTRSHGGIGTGLALSKRILEYMGGALEIISNPGKGTTVTVTLPFEIASVPRNPIFDAQSKDSTHTPVLPNRTTATSRSVLVVEDNPEVRKLIVTLLVQIGIQVDEAKDGQEAHDLAMRSHMNDHPYDLVIMDMQMPVMDGYATTRQLRQQGYQYPIVALTAHAMQGDRQKCLDAGCDDYMIKPIDPAMFIRYIRHWLENPLIRVI